MQDLDLLRLRRAVIELLKPWNGPVPGMTVGIVRGGKLDVHESAGLASLELGVAIGPETCFRIASVSKQFTCAAILMLEAEGRLRLDDPPQRHLPELPDFGAPLTIAHLMHNSSGIRDMLEIMRQGGVDLGHHCTAADLLDGICRQATLNFKPGSRFLYSNSNFFLLGLIVERLTGEPLGKVLESRIFRPLGMTRTRHTPNVLDPVPGLATGYMPHADGYRRARHAFPLGGEGGLVSCVEDLALWDRGLPARLTDGAALDAALQTQVSFPNGTPNLYARGLRIDAWRGLRTVSHGGSWPGFRTEYLRIPALDCAIIAIANTGAGEPDVLAHAVLDVMIEGRADIHPKPILPQREKLAPLAGQWIDSESGMTLDISVTDDEILAVNSGGSTVHPVPATDGRLTVTHGTILLAIRQIDSDTLEIEQDAGHTALWHRAAPAAKLPADMPGRYESAEMATRWTVEATSGEPKSSGMQVRVEGPMLRAAVWNIDPVEEDLVRIWVPGVLANGWFDVRLRRDREGSISGLTVNSNRLRNVEYRRLPD